MDAPDFRRQTCRRNNIEAFFAKSNRKLLIKGKYSMGISEVFYNTYSKVIAGI